MTPHIPENEVGRAPTFRPQVRTFFQMIDRFGDIARVQICSCVVEPDRTHSHITHADYETLSRGATASARKERGKIEAAYARGEIAA